MHNYQLNIRSCHDPDCDYGRQSLTLAMQNFSIWTSFPQISIEMGWEMGNMFGMYICYSPALVDLYWEKLPEVLSTTRGRRPREVLRARAQFLENFFSASNLWDRMGNGKYFWDVYMLFTDLGRSVLGETARGLEYHPRP